MDWQDILEKAKNVALDYGPNLIGALVILILGWLGAKIVRSVIRRLMKRAKLDPTLAGFVGNMVYMLLLAFVIVSALDRLGVSTGSFVAIIGAAGLAIGFALQGSLSNLAAGVMIIMFRPFRQGDFIEAAGTTGSVQEIQVFSTIMNTVDNKRIIVPNAKLMGDVITNYSANDKRRVDLIVGIGYGDDIPKAKAILEKILADHPQVLADPAPVVAMRELADSSVNFNVRPWVRTADYWGVYSDVTEQVKLRFDEEDISIPFPQQDVHLHQVA